jgi:GRAM domain
VEQQSAPLQASDLKEDEEEDHNLEEGAVKVGSKLLTKFQVGENEKCIASYSCAFENKILLQGRLYIFTARICFHSYFNAKVLNH